MSKRGESIYRLVVSLVAVLLAGSSGSFFTNTSLLSWYPTLIKPAFNPPNWVFGPVWTILFLLMGYAFYRIWKQNFDTQITMQARNAFILQMILNVLWNFLFFYLQNPLLGFVGIVALWLSILNAMYRLYKADKIAGIVFIPYFMWVSFAGALNFAIFWLNR